jgi:glycosyltransferase involved in cell wall biosynthesis
MSDADLRQVYARSRGFLLPGEEDFGIATVEALASGKPVLALGKGGALETVPPIGGVLYDEATEAALESALHQLDILEPQVDPQALRQWASQFNQAAFQAKMRRILDRASVPATIVGKSQQGEVP